MSGPFAQDTSGPATATGNNTNKRALVQDHTNNIVETVGDAGLAQALQSALIVLPAQTALTAITTAQTLMSLALPAGALNKANRTIRVSGTLIFTVSTGTPTVTLALKLGSVTLCTIASAALAASTNGQVQFAFTLSVAATGASGTIESHGQLNAQLSTALGTAIASYFDQNTAVSSAVALGTALTLAVTIAGSTAIASAQVRNALIEVLN